MRLLLSFFFVISLTLSLAAQVGVNNPDPEQALDVNGKVKIADDDVEPSAGTMRYNDTDKSFEGYDGGQWNSFNQKGSSALPSNPIPVYGYSTGMATSTVRSLYFSDWQGDFAGYSPPEGKILIITGIYPRPNALAKDADFQFTIGVSNSQDAYGASGTILLIFAETNITNPITGDSAPLFVIQPGQFLTASNESTSTVSINMNVRGFLVDDLSY